jgi:Cys-rich repeat protein
VNRAGAWALALLAMTGCAPVWDFTDDSGVDADAGSILSDDAWSAADASSEDAFAADNTGTIRDKDDAASWNIPPWWQQLDAARMGDTSTRDAGVFGVDAKVPDILSGFCSSQIDCARFGLHCFIPFGATVGLCVPCIADDQCSSAVFPHCDLANDTAANRCVECNVDTDCAPGEVCIGEPSHNCIPSCANNPRCPPRAGICDPIRKVCLGCTSSSQCGTGQVCDPLTGRCGECISNANCLMPDLRRCDLTLDRCVQCLGTPDCPPHEVCTQFGICKLTYDPRWYDQ